MTGKKIVRDFKKYMDENRQKLKILPRDSNIAVIYGTDEFKYDEKGNSIKITGIGWISTGKDRNVNLKKNEIKWVAVKREEGGFFCYFGNFPPYSLESDKNPLYSYGQINAIPYSMSILKST